MTDRRTKAIGFAIVLVVGGLLLVWSGLTPLSQDRDPDGYLLSDPLTIDRLSYAVVTTDIDLLRGHYDCASEESFILGFFSPDDVRMQGLSTGSEALFMGIGPAEDVDGYLEGVAHDKITDWDCDVDDITPVEYTRREGTAVPSPPDDEQFWVRSVSGTGEQEQVLDWTIENGEWAVVIMNTNTTTGVSADVRFGAQAPSGLDAFAWTAFAFGVVALIGGAWLLYLARRWRQNARPLGDTDQQP